MVVPLRWGYPDAALSRTARGTSELWAHKPVHLRAKSVRWRAYDLLVIVRKAPGSTEADSIIDALIRTVTVRLGVEVTRFHADAVDVSGVEPHVIESLLTEIDRNWPAHLTLGYVR
jgi:hypothetical protein